MDFYGKSQGPGPDAEIFIVRNGVKSAVTSRQGQYLRPIYDQIREHVKKHLLNISEGAFILGNYDVSKLDYFVH